MTTDLEDAVRLALAEQARDAPAGALLLAGVHAGHRRQARRRRLAVLSVAAMTAAVASGASLVGVRLTDRTTDRSTSQAAGPLVPVPANWLPAFPLTPGWLPAGLGPARTSYGSYQQVIGLHYTDPKDQARLPNYVRAVYIGTSHTRLFPIQRGVRRSIMIGGKSVTAFSGPIATDKGRPVGQGVEVTWERRPGQWVSITCDSTLGTFENVRRIAESLRDVPVQPTPEFHLAALPKGLTSLGGYGGAELLLLPDGSRDQNKVPEERTLSVMLQKNVERNLIPGSGLAPPGHRVVTVAGYPAWLATSDPVNDLTVAVRDTVVLVIRAPSTIPEAVLLRFAAGITILPGATAFDASP